MNHCTALRLTGLAIALALGAGLGPARAAEAVVKLTRIAGTVESMHADETGAAWFEALPGDELTAGWSLRTGRGGKAQLIFPLDNVVILRENSVLVITGLDSGGGAALEASEGGLLVDIKHKLAGGSEFTVDTGIAQAVVRGTQFGVDFAPPGWQKQSKRRVRFFGYRGLVEVRNGQGSAPLALDEELEVEDGGRPGKAQRGRARGKLFRELLERQGEFEQFEREHPNMAEWVKARNAQRKLEQERAKQARQDAKDQPRDAGPDKDKDKGKPEDPGSKGKGRDKERDKHPGKPPRGGKARPG